MFYRIHVNGEKVKRNWLCYSPTTGKVYCFTCKLMSTPKEPGLFASDGFGDSKHSERGISNHESSNEHCESKIAAMTLGSAREHIDARLVEACDSERILVQRLV